VRSRGQEPEWLDVIGVVEHQRHETLVSEGRETIFVTDGHFGHGVSSTWVLRVECAGNAPCDPTALAAPARATVTALDPLLSVASMQPYTRLVDLAMTPTRFALVLIGVFAGVAVVLACIGLYSVMSTAFRQRTAEFGVRLAFGGSRTSILGLVIGRGMRLGLIGLVIGFAGALALTRSMETMLIGVRPTDPVTYAAIVALFLALVLLACWLPAHRASSLDPTAALRGD
jgi:putative ABC transport system permease protein